MMKRHLSNDTVSSRKIFYLISQSSAYCTCSLEVSLLFTGSYPILKDCMLTDSSVGDLSHILDLSLGA